MSPTLTGLDEQAISAARLLAADAVEVAKSGHPGAAISLAPVAHQLFQKHIRHDPADPGWVGRDRFVLSCGHASMLLYAQLYLTGYDLTIEDIKSFRRLRSRTPGHPEYGVTPGVDVSTGPLGQGFAMAVGMAMAFRQERATYHPGAPEGESPFDRRVWVLASDGDLQEGASYEAGALAGRHELSNLTVIYDDNGIQIEGSTDLAWREDVAGRFRAQGWRVSQVPRGADGDVDVRALDAALAAEGDERPHLVVLKTEIAFPAPTARGTAASHSGALGADELSRLRGLLGSSAAPFEVSEEVLAHTRSAIERGRELHARWDLAMSCWQSANPELARQWQAAVTRTLPDDLVGVLPRFEVGSRLATRDASSAAIQALAPHVPELVGGSADLAEANKTEILSSRSFLPEDGGRVGRNIHWGVRELAMSAAMNGILLAGGLRPFVATFLVFSDFQRGAIRLSALMGLPAIYVWTHDSIALGPDGPTHQPIEHLASLRAMPELVVIRPADANETVAAWLIALEQSGPVGLALCRQPLETLDLPAEAVVDGVRRGAYVVSDDPDASVLIVATGSELALALDAAARIRSEGVTIRVVSMPSRELFSRQDASYRDSVLPPGMNRRVVVEAASPFGWHDVAGAKGIVVGIDHFGLSGAAEDVQRYCGMTADRVVQAIHDVRAR